MTLKTEKSLLPKKVRLIEPEIKELERRIGREATLSKSLKKKFEAKLANKIADLEKDCEMYRDKATELAEFE